ncbi:MAG: hypothetical protein Kow0032_24740 [Methyloligellaceae bacterium]
MTKRPATSRRPRALKPDSRTLVVDKAPLPEEVPVQSGPDATARPAADAAGTALQRGLRWGTLLLSALGGLALMAAGLWAQDILLALLARRDWLGWTALALIALALFSALMILASELWALLRLRRLGRIRDQAQTAITHRDATLAASLCRDITGLYRSRPELAWGRSRLADHERDVLDARERLILVEREILAPLDRQAREIIAASARRVSVTTAISPSTLFDMLIVAAQNLRMLRRIAVVYGVRPGTIGVMKLARMVVTSIVLSGGIAIGDDLIQQMLGHRLTAKLSARLGEGVLNGALTARIGLAALDVCRPLPFIEASRPRLRDLLSLLFK